MKRLDIVFDIYKHEGKDSSNKGLSAFHDSARVVKFETGDTLKSLHERNLLNDNDIIIEDFQGNLVAYDAKLKAEGKHLMFGGCFVYTSHCGFTSSGHAIKLFDRTEF